MIKYIIVTAYLCTNGIPDLRRCDDNYLQHFSDRINELITQGYIPQGGICESTFASNAKISQAMVKNEME